MTSKISFWDSSRENHKRRIWVWIVAVLSQLLVYNAMTMIYLSRIKNRYAMGSFRSVEAFRRAMYQAAKDGLAFSDNTWPVLIFLGGIIGMQGFSYLYDRRKVDMYHSVPVSKKTRFLVIYVNGILIYLAGSLSGLLTGTVIAAAQRAVNVDVLANEGLAFIWNFLLFLVIYHTMILAVMLTGSWFVTLCLFGVLVTYEMVIYEVLGSMKWSFFKTATNYYLSAAPKLSPVYDCMDNILRIKSTSGAAETARLSLPLCGKWILIAAVLFAVMYLCYIKRQSEAAGRAIVHDAAEPVIKIITVLPAALIAGMIVLDTSYENEMLMAAAMLVGGAIFCAAMEVLFDFDIKSIFKHLWSSGIALAGILAVFCIFKWDLIGYDNYIPDKNKVESIAFSIVGYYDNYWNEDFEYISQADYKMEHMFLEDASPVLALAQRFQAEEAENMADPRSVYVLYRLNSGRMVNRSFMIDLEDPAAREQMDLIMGSEAYRLGTYQSFAGESSMDKLVSITYSNGAAQAAVPKEEGERLRKAWAGDMEQYDFSLARDQHPCGQIVFQYKNYMSHSMLVYEGFENTIACLQSLEAYYPVKLDASDIEYVTVTNYHNELTDDPEYMFRDDLGYTFYRGAYDTMAQDAYDTADYVDYTVRETFYDEGQIAQILENVHPMGLVSEFAARNATESNYIVEVVFKKGTTYPYGRDSYYFNYYFLNGQVPEFVAEATAYEG